MEIGEIDFLKVTAFSAAGGFLQLPQGETVTLPKFEQLGPLDIGKEYLVILYQDKRTYTIYASERIDDHLIEYADDRDFHIEQEVDGVVYEFTKLGAKIAINRTHRGFIFGEDIHQELELGEKLKFYIKELREDGRIGLKLQRSGYKGFIGNSTEQIMNALREANGELPFNDKSSPESINQKFKMSKKVFKESIGKLYKERKLIITDSGIKLT